MLVGPIVVSPSDTGIRQARAKTDRLDARGLAKLLWASELDGVWTPDERIPGDGQASRAPSPAGAGALARKNEVYAGLMRCLKERPASVGPVRRQGAAVVGRAAAGGL